MTKNTFQAVGILFLSAAAVMAAPPERWIHVRVESARGVSGNVTINVPIEMASAVLPVISGDQHQSKFSLQASVNGRDLRAVLDAVRNSPDNVSVDLELHDREVSVAKSGGNLLIKIAEKPSADHRVAEAIALKVPISVVRALLAGNSDEIDIAAGMRALAREGDVDVTLNKEKETVRVWTDTRTTSE